MSEEKSSESLNLKVLTPDGPVLEGEVSEVTLPGANGEMGIFPQHAALLTGIVPGRLAYRAPDGNDTAALGRGVAEVQNNEVRVLVDSAILKEELDLPALEGQRKELLDKIDRETHAEKITEFEKELVFIDVQVSVARGEE
ncbi:ATP synthase F1 subunit epsilon [Candidatus Moduliflexota bacterium]